MSDRASSGAQKRELRRRALAVLGGCLLLAVLYLGWHAAQPPDVVPSDEGARPTVDSSPEELTAPPSGPGLQPLNSAASAQALAGDSASEAQVRVTVLAADGTGLEGAIVRAIALSERSGTRGRFDRWPLSAPTTDAAGVTHVMRLDEPMLVGAQHPKTMDIEWKVADGDHCTLTMAPRVERAIRIVNEFGQLVAGASVRLEGYTSQGIPFLFESTSDESGLASLATPLGMGVAIIQAEHEAHGFARESLAVDELLHDVTLRSGDTVRIVIPGAEGDADRPSLCFAVVMSHVFFRTGCVAVAPGEEFELQHVQRGSQLLCALLREGRVTASFSGLVEGSARVELNLHDSTPLQLIVDDYVGDASGLRLGVMPPVPWNDLFVLPEFRECVLVKALVRDGTAQATLEAAPLDMNRSASWRILLNEVGGLVPLAPPAFVPDQVRMGDGGSLIVRSSAATAPLRRGRYRVVDASTDEPIAGAQVGYRAGVTSAILTVSDERGEFEFSRRAGDPVPLVVSAAGFAPQTIDHQPAGSPASELPTTILLHPLDSDSVCSLTVIVAAADGGPLAGARVDVRTRARTVVHVAATRVDGSVSAIPLTFGTYVLAVAPPAGAAALEQTIEVELMTKERVLEVRLKPRPLHAEVLAWVEVVGGTDEVKYLLLRGSKRTLIEEVVDGRAKFPEVPHGSYEVLAQAAGGLRIPLGPVEVASAEVRLRRTVPGLAQLEIHAPMSSSRRQVRIRDARTGRVVTSATLGSEAVTVSLLPGEYEIDVFDDGSLAQGTAHLSRGGERGSVHVSEGALPGVLKIPPPPTRAAATAGPMALRVRGPVTIAWEADLRHVAGEVPFMAQGLPEGAYSIELLDTAGSSRASGRGVVRAGATAEAVWD